MRCVTMHFFLSVATDKLASVGTWGTVIPFGGDSGASFFIAPAALRRYNGTSTGAGLRAAGPAASPPQRFALSPPCGRWACGPPSRHPCKLSPQIHPKRGPFL